MVNKIGKNAISIRGLIDSDGQNITHDNVLVFGNRYTIENYIFDPLCFLAYLSEKSTELYSKYFDGVNCDMDKMDENALQQGINNVLLSWDFECNDMIDVKSIGKIGYKLPRKFIEHKGHDIESLVRDETKNIYDGYRQYDKSKKINFLSVEFVDTFNTLLNM